MKIRFVANRRFIISFREKQLLIFNIENQTCTDNSKIEGNTNGDKKGLIHGNNPSATRTSSSGFEQGNIDIIAVILLRLECGSGTTSHRTLGDNSSTDPANFTYLCPISKELCYQLSCSYSGTSHFLGLTDRSVSKFLPSDEKLKVLQPLLQFPNINRLSVCANNTRKHKIHSKKRNSLALSHLNDLVYIKYNRTLKRHYDACDTIDAIALDNIDEVNEWLVGRPEDQEDELVYEGGDLDWDIVAMAVELTRISIVLGEVLQVQDRLTRARSTYYYIYKFKSDSDPN
ncbi:hypothetical protein H5410_005490 [Solanum commersonii]|uniref:Uncharacterized protein n=1 Tax=Solanum commersonii TaxID=4109 RepID=A0A9J6A7B2_SOLCO|nr:hypothetical protein H5410_005490 [Solanum commersonii]